MCKANINVMIYMGILLALTLLLTACNSDNAYDETPVGVNAPGNNFATTQASEASEMICETTNEANSFRSAVSDLVQQHVENFKSDYDFEINLSALILNVENNETIAYLGDINRFAETHYAFWPISAAILINEHGLDINTEFENVPYIFENNTRLLSPIELFNEDYYEGYISFKQGFLDGNNSIFFHAMAGEEWDAFFCALERMNLYKFDYIPDIPYEQLPPRKLVPIGLGLYASTVEMSLMYASLINGGRLFADIGSSEYVQIFSETALTDTLAIMEHLLTALGENWNVFYHVECPETFKTNVIGSISTYMSYNEIGLWFAGFFPAESPRYVAVFNLSHSHDNHPGFVTMRSFTALVYNIMSYVLSD